MRVNTCVQAASKQAGPSSLGPSLCEPPHRPADGSRWPRGHSRWDPPHLTPPALQIHPPVVAAQAPIIVMGDGVSRAQSTIHPTSGKNETCPNPVVYIY